MNEKIMDNIFFAIFMLFNLGIAFLFKEISNLTLYEIYIIMIFVNVLVINWRIINE